MTQTSFPTRKPKTSQYTIGSLLVSIQGDARVSVRRMRDEGAGEHRPHGAVRSASVSTLGTAMPVSRP